MSLLAGKALAVLIKNWRLALVAGLLAAMSIWGFWGEYRVNNLEEGIAKTKLQVAKDRTAAAEDAAARERQARAAESKMTDINRNINDELTKTMASRDAAARTASQRLRQLAELRTASAATEAALTECRSYEGPAVRVIPGPTREALIQFSRQADEVADQLRACQRYIGEVTP